MSEVREFAATERPWRCQTPWQSAHGGAQCLWPIFSSWREAEDDIPQLANIAEKLFGAARLREPLKCFCSPLQSRVLQASRMSSAPSWKVYRTFTSRLKMYSSRLTAAGSSAAIEMREYTRPFMGYPASGRPIAVRSIDIWRVENRRFVEHWEELNTLETFQQIGRSNRILPDRELNKGMISTVDVS